MKTHIAQYIAGEVILALGPECEAETHQLAAIKNALVPLGVAVQFGNLDWDSNSKEWLLLRLPITPPASPPEDSSGQ